MREDAVLDALEGQPLDGHLAAGRLVLVFVDVEKFGQAEVGDLDAARVLDEDVTRGQVAVHQPPVLQIGHAARDLRAPVEQRLGADLVTIVAHVVEQAAEWHQLRNQHHLRRHAHGQQLQQVRVLDAGHDVRFVQDLAVRVRAGALTEHLNGHRNLDVLALGHPYTLNTEMQKKNRSPGELEASFAKFSKNPFRLSVFKLLHRLAISFLIHLV